MSSVSDAHSVDNLYRNHHGWLRGWLRKRMGCSEAAADLTHDTFLRVLASSRQPSALGGEPRALLTHIAKGLVVDHWRRQSVERAYLDALAQIPADEAPSAEAQVLIIEALTRIDEMLSSMPGRTREIFLLAQLDGLTLKQISQRTDTPVITVRRHIRKALLACMTVL
jgi:RNA polymerase sigma-70 factor (ECF subfamily)